MTTQITIEVDEDQLASYTDQHLALCWHVAQANPADGFATREPGELAERIGREIIRRWLRAVPPELWHHQGRHYYWKQQSNLGKWVDGVFVSGEPAIPAETPQSAT